jgi:putative oxidoreductase
MGTIIIYWITTILFSLLMLMSGIGTLKSPKLINDFKRLGFPKYFRKQVAISKIVGAITLLIPFLPNIIKEWTYSGFFILLVSAIVAHFAVKDTIKSIVLPLILLAVLTISYCSFR